MIPLREVHTSLSLFAEAIKGQPVSFIAADDRGLCWPWAYEPVGHTHVGTNVVLPQALERRTDFRAVLLHQLVRDGSAVRHRGSLFERFFDIVESYRVAAEIRRVYRGAVRDMDQLLAEARIGITEPGSDSVDVVEVVFVALRHHTLGAQPSRDDMSHDDVALVLRAIQILGGSQELGATAATSYAITERLIRLVQGHDMHDGTRILLAEPDDEELPGVESDASTGVSLDGGTPNDVVDGHGAHPGQLSTDLGDQTYSPTEADDGEQPVGGLKLPIAGSPFTHDGRRTFVYDEWDYHQRAHRPAWCRVVEERLVGHDHDFIAEVRDRHHQLRAQVRHRLLQLPAQSLMRVHRSLDGDELDLDAAIEAVVDRRSGAPVDDRLQIRRDRAARDVATAFLVDLSASTSSPAVVPEPEPLVISNDPFDDPMSSGPIWDAPRDTEPVRRVIDVAKDAVALMGDALQELGDRYAVYGFSGTGRDGVEFKIGKDFSDRSNPATWASIAEMKPLRYTRMGPAVRHAAAKLQAVGAQTKLLIVVSDGYPQDVDYGADRNDRDYGVHDTARAIADAERAGIGTFCVTIDPAGHDYLRTMCPDGRYLVIDDVESLPEELAKVYLRKMGV